MLLIWPLKSFTSPSFNPSFCYSILSFPVSHLNYLFITRVSMCLLPSVICFLKSTCYLLWILKYSMNLVTITHRAQQLPSNLKNPNPDLPCPRKSALNKLTCLMLHHTFSDFWNVLLLFLEVALSFLTLLLLVIYHVYLCLSKLYTVLEIQKELNEYFLVREVKIEWKCLLLHKVSPETVCMESQVYFLPFVNSCGTNGPYHFQNVGIFFRR